MQLKKSGKVAPSAARFCSGLREADGAAGGKDRQRCMRS